jgi:non-ribosomal peptide synthetase component E (peptide arylation enzyme)
MKKPRNPKFFAKEDRGFIELYFSSEEIASILEVLSFTRKLCESLVAKNDSMEEDVRHMLMDKGLAAHTLQEKIQIDADPGKPVGPLH